MAQFATTPAKMDIMVLVLFAGRIAPVTALGSRKMVSTATSQKPMEEAPAKFTSSLALSNGAPSGTPSATTISIMLDVASAHLIAQPA